MRKIQLNPRFRELWNNKDRYLILYGSRSSSKSDFIATQIVSNLMTHKYYSLIAVRRTYESIMESSFKTLVEKINDLGVEKNFVITKSPMKIVCKSNSNQVIFRGLDDSNKLKSIKDPSGIWWEEDIPDTLDEYLTISLSLRGSKSEYIQEIFTINPVIDNYEEHWFWKMFFKDQAELSFRTCIEDVMNGKTIKQYATVHQSSWRDNLFLSDQDKLAFKSLENDPVAYQQQSLGLWCNRIVKNQFYKNFKLNSNTGEFVYDRTLPLHLSFDFNVSPFITCTVWQGSGKEVWQIKEFCLSNPDNTTKGLCAAIRSEYRNHEGGMFIYGDCNGYNKDTRSQKGENDYSIIFKELAIFHPSDRTTRTNPSVKTRGNFINDLLVGNIKGCSLLFRLDCKNSINDMLMLREAPDGTKLKEKMRNRDTGVTYEKYGHCSDTLDYFICKYFEKEYLQYKAGGVSRYGSGSLGRNSRNKCSNY